MTRYGFLTALTWVMTIVALVVVLAGCKGEKTSNEPRPALVPAADERTGTDG